MIVRPINILILCLTQFSLWFKLGANSAFESADLFRFSILCLCAALIAAAGYIINDINDFEIDLHNKPGKVYVGTLIPKKYAWILYFTLNSIAVGLSLFLQFELLIINILSIFLLYFYSFYFKKYTTWGNFIIALLSAAVVFEIFRFVNSNELQIKYLFLFYIIFSFLTTLLREIVKDLEDINGDVVFKRKTLAIILGIPKTKMLLYFINFVILGALFCTYIYIESGVPLFSKMYFQIILFFPLILFLLIAKAGEKSKFSRLSFLMKLYMLLGICWLWTF